MNAKKGDFKAGKNVQVPILSKETKQKVAEALPMEEDVTPKHRQGRERI